MTWHDDDTVAGGGRFELTHPQPASQSGQPPRLSGEEAPVRLGRPEPATASSTDHAARQSSHDAFEARYHSLAAATCEWRAFELADPDAMADEVFRQLRADKRPPDLRLLYKAVEGVAAQAYSQAAARKTLRDGIFGFGGSFRPDDGKDPKRPVRDALAGLGGRDGVLLRQAYWDELTPDEMAEVNGGTAQAQSERLEAAVKRFAARLRADRADDPVSAMRDIQPGTHRRNPEG